MKNLKFLSIVFLTALMLLSFTVVIQKKWEVPAKFKSMKNPTDIKDKDGMAEGKTLYAKNCVSCHGKKGLGDGSKAAELEGDLGDFSSAGFQKKNCVSPPTTKHSGCLVPAGCPGSATGAGGRGVEVSGWGLPGAGGL